MSTIEVGRVSSGDRTAVGKLVRQFFSVEPLSKSLNVDAIGGADAFTDEVFPASVNDGVSVVAVDPTSGDTVAFSIAGIVRKGAPVAAHFSKDDIVTRNLAHVFEIAGELYSDLDKDLFSKYNVDELVNIRGLFVSQKYQRQGIATKMVRRTLDLCRGKNIGLVSAEATGVFSSKVFENVGFETLVEHSYDSIKVENEPLKITDELKFHKRIALYVKLL